MVYYMVYFTIWLWSGNSLMLHIILVTDWPKICCWGQFEFHGEHPYVKPAQLGIGWTLCVTLLSLFLMLSDTGLLGPDFINSLHSLIYSRMKYLVIIGQNIFWKILSPDIEIHNICLSCEHLSWKYIELI